MRERSQWKADICIGNIEIALYFSLQSFKLNVDSHCALKEAVEEEGHQLLELIASHKAGKSS